MAAAARTPKAFPSGEGNLLPYDLAAVLPKFVAAVINRHHLKEVAIDNRRYTLGRITHGWIQGTTRAIGNRPYDPRGKKTAAVRAAACCPCDLAAVLPKFAAAVIDRHHLTEVAIGNRRYIPYFTNRHMF